MRRSQTIGVIVLALAGSLLLSSCAKGDKEPDRVKDTQAAHLLLSRYLDLFKLLAGNGTTEMVLQGLDKNASEAHALEREGAASGEFFRRHQRLVEVTRLIMTPDPDGSRRRETIDKVSAFVQSVKGGPPAELKGGLADVAPAIADEVLNLHMLLDGSTDREKTREKYLKGIPPGS